MTWYCEACGLTDLACMNRERMDGFRCCQRCTGHDIPVTDRGREFLAASGHPGGDGITLMQLMVQAERRGNGP